MVYTILLNYYVIYLKLPQVAVVKNLLANAEVNYTLTKINKIKNRKKFKTCIWLLPLFVHNNPPFPLYILSAKLFTNAPDHDLPDTFGM